MTNTTRWRGGSGDVYEFSALQIDALFPKSLEFPVLPKEPGVYIFSRVEQSLHVPIYIGSTGNLNRRLNVDWSGHHRKDCIERNEAAWLHVHVTSGHRTPPLALDAWETIERDLIAGFDPPCNKDR